MINLEIVDGRATIGHSQTTGKVYTVVLLWAFVELLLRLSTCSAQWFNKQRFKKTLYKTLKIVKIVPDLKLLNFQVDFQNVVYLCIGSIIEPLCMVVTLKT